MRLLPLLTLSVALVACGDSSTTNAPAAPLSPAAPDAAAAPPPTSADSLLRTAAAQSPPDSALPVPVVSVAADRTVGWTVDGSPDECHWQFRRRSAAFASGWRIDSSGWTNAGSSTPYTLRYRTASPRVACRWADRLGGWGVPETESKPTNPGPASTAGVSVGSALAPEEWTDGARLIFRPPPRTAAMRPIASQNPPRPSRYGYWSWTPTVGATHYRIHKGRESSPGTYYGASTNLPYWWIGSQMGYPGDTLERNDLLCVSPRNLANDEIAAEVCAARIRWVMSFERKQATSDFSSWFLTLRLDPYPPKTKKDIPRSESAGGTLDGVVVSMRLDDAQGQYVGTVANTGSSPRKIVLRVGPTGGRHRYFSWQRWVPAGSTVSVSLGPVPPSTQRWREVTTTGALKPVTIDTTAMPNWIDISGGLGGYRYSAKFTMSKAQIDAARAWSAHLRFRPYHLLKDGSLSGDAGWYSLYDPVRDQENGRFNSSIMGIPGLSTWIAAYDTAGDPHPIRIHNYTRY